jgi:hypothetical protein
VDRRALLTAVGDIHPSLAALSALDLDGRPLPAAAIRAHGLLPLPATAPLDALRLHALAAAGTSLESAAAAVSTAADCNRPAAAIATAASCDGASAVIAATMDLGVSAAMSGTVAAGLGAGRHGNRQSGHTCGQEQPGHEKSPFNEAKRARRARVPPFTHLGPRSTLVV